MTYGYDSLVERLMNRLTIVLLALTVSLLAAVSCSRHPGASSPIPECVSAEALVETDILPHTQGAITAGRNQVYCATFQVAWNDFQNAVLKQPIQLSGSPPMAKSLQIDRGLAPEVLPAGSYLVKSGLVKDGVVDAIRNEMGQRFPEATFRVPADLQNNAAVAYAYLQKSLLFREAFDRLEEPLVFHAKSGPVGVACFGVRKFRVESRRDKVLAGQITVLQYVSDDDFILQLNTEANSDQIVLAKTAPKETHAASLADVYERAKKPVDRDEPEHLGGRESLVVPVLNVHVVRRYHELEGLDLDNRVEGLERVVLAVAEQGVRFRLDETGARLESSANMRWKSTGKSSGSSQATTPRVLARPCAGTLPGWPRKFNTWP